MSDPLINMELKLSSTSIIETLLEAVSSSLSSTKLYFVTEDEYNIVPRPLITLFSPFLAELLQSAHGQEETPSVVLQDVKSETIKNLVDLLQNGQIQIKSGEIVRKEEIIEDILNLAKTLSIEMKNLKFSEDREVLKRESAQSGDYSQVADEFLLYEENLFCLEVLDREDMTGEYFEQMTIADEQIKEEKLTLDDKEEGCESEKVRNNIKNEELSFEGLDEEVAGDDMKEEGEISSEEEVETFQCGRCRYRGSSRLDLERHTTLHHRQQRRERARHSRVVWSGSERQHHRHRAPDHRRRF